MTSSAILMMTLTMVTITGFAAYFFIKVLRTPPKSERKH